MHVVLEINGKKLSLGMDENGIKHINIPSLSEGAEYKVITINTDGDKTSVRSKIISVE